MRKKEYEDDHEDIIYFVKELFFITSYKDTIKITW
ncbi:MAG: hypothetical protein JWR09_151 [Mucilaginibacter sp.]|nr:hypothetical protein [Mucilaginibacter sp.]